jgi:hypothetical protein
MAKQTKTTIDSTAMELVDSIVQQELIQSMVLAPTLLDVSNRVGPGLDKVKLPRLGSYTAAAKADGTDLTSQALSATTDDLNLDQYYAVFTTLERLASLQANIDLVGEVARRMASALAYEMDAKIYAQMKLTSSAAPDHRIAFDNASTLAKNDFVMAKKLLKIQNVPMSDGKLFCAISPERESDILKLADFVDADKWMGGSESAKLNGVIGKAYGFQIVVSNVVEDAGCIFYHSDHVAWARQLQPTFDEDKNVPALGFDLALSHVYGCKVTQAGKMGVLVGSAT